jgi:hypothetical protein
MTKSINKKETPKLKEEETLHISAKKVERHGRSE